jgi:peptidyl-prolyl cis-trans isomerase D
MLRGIRNASSNWLGKGILVAVMSLLILSFAVWGIADIFRGFGRSTVVTVGSTEIGVEQFRQIYNDRLQQFGRQIGRPLTMEQARQVGMDRQVLSQVMAEAALDEQTRRMKLGISDADVLKVVMEDPNFRGIGGRFDPQRFQATIRQFGYTEPRYLAEQRKLMLRRQIASTLTENLTLPKTMVEAFLRVRDEQRSVEYARLDAEQAGTIEEPALDVLTKYFEDNKALFRAPEYRKIAFVTATPADLAKTIVVPDEEAQKFFTDRRDRYSTPERRQVAQIVFPNLDEAKAARERIRGGLSFADLVKERNLNPSDVDLGLQTKAGIVDPAAANAAFSLNAGEISDAVQGRFGGLIVEVRKIEPGVTPTFEEKSAEVKAEMAQERSRTALQQVHNKMEDERGGGAPVAEAATKAGLKPTIIEAVDRSGRGPDGKLIEGLPAGVDVVSQGFSADVGIENDPVQVNGGYVWYDVVAITRSRDRTFDEAKEQVTQRWRDQQIATLLKAKADEMVTKLNAGGNFVEIAKGAGVTSAFSPLFKRSTTNMTGISPALVEAAFKVNKDQAGQAPGDNATQIVVFRVNQVIEPTLDMESADAKSLADTLKTVQSDELLGQFIQRLQTDIGSSINQTAFDQVTGKTPLTN